MHNEAAASYCGKSGADLSRVPAFAGMSGTRTGRLGPIAHPPVSPRYQAAVTQLALLSLIVTVAGPAGRK